LPGAKPVEGDGLAAWNAWRTARAARLAAPDSWLGVVGLFWLNEADGSDNTVGSDPAAVVVLPAGPPRLGVLRRSGETLTWLPDAGDPQPLQTDRRGAPTVVSAGSLAFFAIEREGRLAVRVRDLDWATQRPFAGIETFAYDPAWRIEAEWRPLDPPQTMAVPDVTGEQTTVTVERQAVFRIGDAAEGGKEVALLPMRVSESTTFFVFRDATSGRQTYGAGRFLDAGPAEGDRLVLDFNFAYNPPCAFTAFATCPLPPPENWLDIAVSAGELRPGA